MKTKKPDLFVFNGKYMECPSVFELRQEVTDLEWMKIVKETLDFYSFMKAAEILGPAKMDKDDARLFRRLGKTIALFKQIDPTSMTGVDIQTIIEEQAKSMKSNFESVQQTIKIARRGTKKQADIYVSDI